MRRKSYKLYRLNALLFKEIIQLMRDRLTLVSLLLVPLIQVFLFSSVINSDPKHLPTAILDLDPSPLSRTIIKGLENTAYFDITYVITSEEQAEKMLINNQVQFVISIPPNFSRDLIHGDKPKIVLEADAVNPIATVNALNTAKSLEKTILQDNLQGVLKPVQNQESATPFEFVLDPKFNPENNSRYFSVPGLISAVMGTAALMMTLISITREKEQGTIESLLATPVKPLEVILSKLIPSIILSYIQFTVMILIANLIFHIPIVGSVALLYFAAFFFITASLLLGLFISNLVSAQYQAVQLSALFLLPNILFTGFVFPFKGMPLWGQWIGEILPLTHFLRILTGIMLKGSNFFVILNDIWPMALFIVVVISLSTIMFRQTLD